MDSADVEWDSERSSHRPGVLPRDFAAGYGRGRSRALVLGGGGVFFVAWQVTYLREMQKRGVFGSLPDLVVGTSAGSVVGSVVAGDGLHRLATEVALLSRAPHIIAALAPAERLSGSQERALAMFAEAADSLPATLRAIGHAALAAHTPPSGELRRHMALMLAMHHWPTVALQIVTVDCYSGERIVLDAGSGVTPARAASASSAVPGIFPPQPVADRFCMDGGVSGSATHTDLAAGSRRALVLALQAGGTGPHAAGMTKRPDDFAAEVRSLRDSGTRVMVRGPRDYTVEELMSASSAPRAVAMAEEQAAADADEFAQFWS